MKLKFSVIVLLLLASVMISANEREGLVTIKFNIPVGNAEKNIRLWVPYPLSDEYQMISDVMIEGNFDNYAIYRAPGSGAILLFAEWAKLNENGKLVFRFQVKSQERGMPDFVESGKEIPREVLKYLEPTHGIPTDAEIRVIAEKITKDKNGILEKSRAVYDWVVENTFRDPDVKGCGLGIVEQTLAKRGGKCADISSVYVALSRAAGIPAREVFGLRLGKKQEQDMTGGHHCWAEFYLPGNGWIQLDPADVRKIMLINNLDLEDAHDYKEYYFGKVDQYRIVLERGGRGIDLFPQQDDEPLNYFMYPYAEVDGKALDYLDPSGFSYSVSFVAL